MSTLVFIIIIDDKNIVKQKFVAHIWCWWIFNSVMLC